MAEFFVLPQSSPTMEVGVLLAWKKPEGTQLVPQDVIAEIETDKAAMEVEVFDRCVLLKQLAEPGVEVPVGHPIAIMGNSQDEDISALLREYEQMSAAPAPTPAPAAAEPAPAPAAAEPAPAPAAAEPAPAPQKIGFTPFTWQDQPIEPGIMEMPESFIAGPPPAESSKGNRVRAAPAARKVARELGIDLSKLTGTGPRGRIVREDVQQASLRSQAAATEATGRASEQIRNSQMRKTIARRLKAVWQDAPAFYLTACFDCDRMVEFRSQLKAAGVKVSYNDIIIKACAYGLRDIPAVNASWGEDAISRHNAVHIGVAVAVPDGLITPVVRNPDQKGLATISSEIRELASRARVGKLKPNEYQGSTFTISNLGMMGIEQFTAILNPPEAIILAVGGMTREPVVDADGNLGVGYRMRVTLTCDHRVVDGALGAEFLQAVRRYIESPALLAS